MQVKFGLLPNKLVKKEEVYRAVIINSLVADDEMIIEHMHTYGSQKSKAAARGALEDYHVSLEFFLERGYTINTSAMYAKLSVSGNFHAETEKRNAKKHKLHLNIEPGKRLLRMIEKVKLKRVKMAASRPYPRSFHDVKTKSTSETSPGNLISIQGSLLKFNSEDQSQGVFFVKGKEEFRCSQVYKNKPSELMLFVPDELSVGEYKLLVRNKPRNNTQVKEALLEGSVQVKG